MEGDEALNFSYPRILLARVSVILHGSTFKGKFTLFCFVFWVFFVRENYENMRCDS